MTKNLLILTVKKHLLFLFIFCFVLGFSQSADFNSAYVVLNNNGVANKFYKLKNNTADLTNPNFNGSDLGSFNAGSTLLLQGAEHNVFKCGSCDLTATKINYRVYKTGTTPGSFSTMNIGFSSGGGNGCGGQNQQWRDIGGSNNLLSGLSSGGNYTVEVYSDATITCGSGTAYDSNGGSNYKATFTYCGPTTGALPAGNYSIPGCFATVNAAVTYINANGITGTGGVQFDVAAGYTETAPVGGFSITATGTAANPIKFVKSGSGSNPTFTAPVQDTTNPYDDAIFKIIGGDYITIDGFTMQERTTGTFTYSGTSNNVTEFGVALFYASSSNGAQNCTIKNCTIDMDINGGNSYGIYSNSSHNSTAPTTSNNSTATTGANSNLTITGNTIADVNTPIVVIGSSSTATDLNDGLIIGGSLADANTITNFGKTAPTNTFNAVTGTINGILIRNTKNFTVSYNVINNTAIVTPATLSTLRAVFVDGYSNTPTGTNNISISNNKISLKANGATVQGINISSNSGTANSVAINNNEFSNFTIPSGALTFLSNSQTATNSSINANEFQNLSIASTGSITFISNGTSAPSGGSKTVNNNKIVTGFTKSGAGGTVAIYNDNASSVAGSIVVNNGNDFSNLTLPNASTTITGWVNTDYATSNPTKTIENNKFENWSITAGANCVIMDLNGFGGTTSSVSNNSIKNISKSSTFALTGIQIGSVGNATTLNVSGNTVEALTSATGSLIGIQDTNASTVKNITLNTLKNLTSATTNTLTAINHLTSTTTVNISNNTITDINATGTTARGINNGTAATVNIENNTIDDINLSNSLSNTTIIGVSCSNAASGTTAAIKNNILSNFVSNSTPTTSQVLGINLSGSQNFDVSNNQIYNFTGVSQSTSTGSAASVIGVFTSSSGASQKINKNIIHSLKNNTTSASSTTVLAIGTSSTSAGGEIIGNRIYGFENKATGTNPFISAFIPNGGNWTFANNMVSLINGSNTNGMQCTGIFDSGSSGTRNYYYNTIYIGGSSSGTQNSVGLQYNSGAGAANIRNNILNTARTGSGKNYSIANLSAAITGFTSTNNVLNASNASTIAATNGITDRTFAAWQALGYDANSFNNVPMSFTDITTADLHLPVTACSDVESGGIPVSVTTDYDSVTRSTTMPDIGADEITGTKPAVISLVASSASVCEGSSVNITASSTENYTYTWDASPTLNTTSGAAVIASPIVTTTYFVNGVSAAGCVKRSSITVTVNPSPTAITAITETQKSATAITSPCDVDYVELKAVGGSIAGLTKVVNSGTVNLSIPDGILTTGISQTLAVSGISTNAIVTKVEVKINITHTWDNDLRVNLEAPNGKIVNLINQAGSSDDNFTNTIITSDTSAGALSSGSAPFTGTFRADLGDVGVIGTTPNVNTINFSDLFTTPNGNWKVRVYDDTATDTGTLVDCSLIVTYTDSQITWSPTTGLYSDTALTLPYNGTDYLSTVYAAPTTATSYTAKATLGTCDKTSVSSPIVRNKEEYVGVGADWNTASNWFPAVVPDNTKCAVIPAGKTIVININNAEAKSLTIAETGKVSIAANSSLKVVDAINIPVNNSANDNLVLESNAALLQDNASPGNVGNIIVKRGTHMRKSDYTYWGTPVTGQKLLNTAGGTTSATHTTGGFSEGTPNNRIYRYNEPDDTFKAATDPEFVSAKGYAIRGKDSYFINDPNPVADEFKFTGTPNNGNYFFDVKKSKNTISGGVTYDHGYNMIANPYPSHIDFIKFYNLSNNTGKNSDVIFGKAWFWTNVPGAPTTQNGSSYTPNNYAILSLAGGTPATGVDVTETTGSPIPNEFIKVAQGFIVQMRGTPPTGTDPALSGTLKFDNSIRTNNMTGNFYNSKIAENEINRYWVKLISPYNIVNTILVAHMDGATNSYDPDYDADLLSLGDDSFYSKLNTQKLQIQARNNPLNTEDVISLGTKYSTNGTYKIALGDREGIFESGQKIYLKDKLTGNLTDLTNQDYIFTVYKGADETRFEIVYKSVEVLASDELKKSDFLVYRDGEYFVIKSSNNLDKVEIYDAGGKLLVSKSTSQKEIRFNANMLPTGVYIIKAQNSGNVKTKKIIK